MSAMVPDELYALFRHKGSKRGFPDSEEVEWFKMDDEYYTDKPGPRFTYKRQGEAAKVLSIPSDEAWKKFMEQIEDIGVFSWKNDKAAGKSTNGRVGDDYAPRIWDIEIKRPGKKVFEREGPIDKLPPNFDKFCDALSELMGGQRFGVE